MKQTLRITALSLLLSCASPERTHAPELLGTWQNTFLIVESAEADQMDPTYQMLAADSTNWDRVMGMKPVRTTFKEDGRFEAEYRNLQDSIYTIARGEWYTAGDSLHFFQWEPDTFAATWRFGVVQDTLHLEGIVDWDRDGYRNDHYVGTQKKIK